MPRLDNTNKLVIEDFELPFNPFDPGETPPVDLCYACWTAWETLGLEVDHPPYEDHVYTCLECGASLGEADNTGE